MAVQIIPTLGKKAGWITDLHVVDSNFEVLEKVFTFMIEKFKGAGVDFIVITGDIFDKKNNTKGTEYSFFSRWLKKFLEIGPVIMTVGNHDYCIEHTVHTLERYTYVPGVYVVDEQAIMGDHLFLSFCRNEARFDALVGEALEVCPDLKYLWGHFDCDGFDLSGTGKEEIGHWSATNKFAGFYEVNSGHYHKRQEKKVKWSDSIKESRELSEGQKDYTTVTYLGTSYTESRSEANQEKFIAVVNMETCEKEFIKTPFTLHKRVKLKLEDGLPEELPEDADSVDYAYEVTMNSDQLKSLTLPPHLEGRVIPRTAEDSLKRLDIDLSESTEAILEKYTNYKCERLYGKDASKWPVDAKALVRKGLAYASKSLQSETDPQESA